MSHRFLPPCHLPPREQVHCLDGVYTKNSLTWHFNRERARDNDRTTCHLSTIVPFVYHSLSRLWDLQQKATKQRSIAIPQPCRDDLKLMSVFLKKAFMGIDINLISFRRPTHIYRSDSCPFGLGGYSHKGFAWRLELQEQYCFCTSKNLLGFITSIITPWIDMTSKRLQPGDCVSSMTDNTTSTG